MHIVVHLLPVSHISNIYIQFLIWFQDVSRLTLKTPTDKVLSDGYDMQGKQSCWTTPDLTNAVLTLQYDTVITVIGSAFKWYFIRLNDGKIISYWHKIEIKMTFVGV